MKIALLGYGKMGKTIERLARERGHEIVLIVDENNRTRCTDEQLKQADVAIEFTMPAVAVENYNWCFRNRVPVVSGTTGWLEKWDEVVTACERSGGTFFYASNYSIGVNIFFHLNRWLSQTMARFSDDIHSFPTRRSSDLRKLIIFINWMHPAVRRSRWRKEF